MTCTRSRSRTLLLAVLAAAFPAAIPAAAQQPAVNTSPPSQPAVPPSAQPGAGPGSQPLVSPPPPSAQAPATAAPGQAAQAPAPPSWMQGAPSTAAESKLAPVPALPIATAIDKLPVNKLTLPEGFNIEIYAAGLTNARSLRVDDEGNVYVSTRTIDKIYAVTEKNGEKEVKTLATGLNSPNGIALHNGTLYIAEISKISKIDNIAAQLANPPKPTSSMTTCQATRRTAGSS